MEIGLVGNVFSNEYLENISRVDNMINYAAAQEIIGLFKLY